MKTLIAALAATTLLAGCQQMNDSYSGNKDTYRGAGIGAVLGAGLGSLTGDGSTERRQRATVGAAIGAVAGAAIGQYMDSQEGQLRDSLQGSGVEVSRQGDNILLNMPSNITFAVDSANIQSQFYGTLNDVASVLTQYPETQIQVLGHTDSTGSHSYNQGLSERRAWSVSNFLGNKGVSSARLSGVGFGETQPIADNASDYGRAQNRRVEVRIMPIYREQG